LTQRTSLQKPLGSPGLPEQSSTKEEDKENWFPSTHNPTQRAPVGNTTPLPCKD